MWAYAPAPVHAPTYLEEAGTHQNLLVLISRISPASAALSYLEMELRAKQLPWICSDQNTGPDLCSAEHRRSKQSLAVAGPVKETAPLSLSQPLCWVSCVLGPSGAARGVWFGRCGAAWPQSWEQPQPGLRDCKAAPVLGRVGGSQCVTAAPPHRVLLLSHTGQTHTWLEREHCF